MYEETTLNGYRLSPQQERLWRLLADTQTPRHFRSACAAEVSGGLDVQRLARALALAGVRHESLRTSFETMPGLDLPLQVVGDEARPATVRECEGGGDFETLLARLLDEELSANGEGVRAAVAKSSEGRTLLVLSATALCADAASMANLLRELPALYAEADGAGAHGDDAESDVVQYVQFSEWQHELLAEGVEVEDEDSTEVSPLEFWRERPEGAAAAPALPLCAEPHAIAASAFAPRRVGLSLGGETRAALDALASKLNVGPEAVLFAAWQTWLCRLTGELRVLTHVSAGCRPFEEMAGAVGLYAKSLPLATNYREQETFAEAVVAAARTLTQAHTHQEYYSPASTQEGVEDSTRAGLLGFAYEDWFADESVLNAGHGAASLSLRPLYANSISDRFRLRLRAARRADALQVEFDYDSAEVSHESARRWVEGYGALLSAALTCADAPCRSLPALGVSERSLLLDSWAGVAVPATAPAGTLTGLLRDACARRPGEQAVVCGSDSVTFAELDAASDRLARLLRARGLGAGSVVALVMPRGVAAVVAAVAAWKAGAAYLPLDPEQPARRLRFMAEDSRASLVVASAETERAARSCGSAPVLLFAEALAEAEGCDQTPLEDDSSPSDLAYVIYTSGSTGEPKGVMVTRSSLLSLRSALGAAVYAGLGEGPLRVSVNAPLYFDASVKQVAQLLSGHTLVIIPEGLRLDPAALVGYAREERVDVLDATPSLLRLLMDAGLCEGASRPLAVLSGGEAIDEALWARLGAEGGGVRFHNLYGPTECTVDATSRLVGAGAERPTIGRPLTNTRVYVMDARGELVPAGATGELYIGGAGVARGYLNRPALTAERFVPDPFSAVPGARLYRTGDVVRYLASGELEYVGRADRQVKLRGYRVELGEVESALRRQPGVRDAAALLRGEPGRERLVAYVAGSAAASDPFGGAATHRLPDGRRVAHRNRNETDYLYEELFTNRSYFRHGVGLAEGAVVFDVGANIGMFTLLALDECPTARVYAFEPLSEVGECLRANARAYGRGRVRVFGHGLSDAEREEEFSYYPRYTMMSGERRYADAEAEVGVIERYLENAGAGGDSEAEELLAHSRGLLEGRFEERREVCRLRRLWEVMEEEGVEWVDLLKVDVQRAETDVLRGLGERGWARVGQVVMEVHDGDGGGSGRVRELKEGLGARGFLVEAEQDELLEGTDRWNLYAVREDYAEARAAGVARQAARGGAAWEPEGGECAVGVGLDSGAVRAGVERELPEYMRPASYVLLESLPLTRNGKVDYRALPDPAEAAGAGEEETRAATPVEELLCGVWGGLLKVGRVRPTDNFFELGGHSLLATQLVSRVREACGVELPLRALFESPTVEGMAKSVEARLRGGDAGAPPPVTRAERGESAPLSFAQQRLWFIDRLEGGSPFYNSPAAVRLKGALDAGALGRTLSEVVRRHEALRTRFVEVGGEPRQVVEPFSGFALPLTDLSGMGEAEREAEAARLAAEEAREPFDLSRGPLLRARLLRLADEEHVALFTMHHIVSDGWSMGVLVKEVAALYEAYAEGRESPLEELPVQYADYAVWQREWLTGEVMERQLSYWRRQLGGALPVVELPADAPRSSSPSHRGAAYTATVEPAVAEALRELSKREGVTLYMTMLAAFQLLISRYTGLEDVPVGTAVANRTRGETEGLIGFFVNTLVMRGDLSGDPSFRELLGRVREVCLGAYAHQETPFERLVEELQPERMAGRTPLVQVAFGVQNTAREELSLKGLTLSGLGGETEAGRFELTVWVSEREDGGLGVRWSYDPALYARARVERMQGHFGRLLEGAVAEPEARVSAIEMLTEEERERRRTKQRAAAASSYEKFKRLRPGAAGAGVAPRVPTQ